MSLWLIHVDVWQKSAQHCKAIIIQLKINKFLRYVYSFRDFPGSPMVKTLLSNVGGRAGMIPSRAVKVPHALWPKTKTQNRSNTVTNSMKTLKMVHIKKIF